MEVRNPHPQIAVCALPAFCPILTATTVHTEVRSIALPLLDKWVSVKIKKAITATFHVQVSKSVPRTGFEPARPQRAQGPQPCVSTNSTIWAFGTANLCRFHFSYNNFMHQMVRHPIYY